MNRYFDNISSQEIKHSGKQPRRLASDKGKFLTKAQSNENDFYGDIRSREKYDRSERKDLIRIARKIYIRSQIH